MKTSMLIFAVMLYVSGLATAQEKQLENSKLTIPYDLVKITKLKGKFNSKYGRDSSFYMIDLKLNSLKYDSVFIDKVGKFATADHVFYVSANKNVKIFDSDKNNLLNQSEITSSGVLMSPSMVIIPKIEEFPKVSRQEPILNPTNFTERLRAVLNNYFSFAFSDVKNDCLTYVTIFKKQVVKDMITYTAILVKSPIKPKDKDLYEISFLTKECKTKDSELHVGSDNATQVSIDILNEVIRKLKQ